MANSKIGSEGIKRVFITVLGAGNYRETKYYLQDNPEVIYVTRFSPVASLQLIDEKPDVVVVLMTEKAREVNWDDGMKSALEEIGYKNDWQAGKTYKPVIIPEGFARDELEEIVQIIFDQIPEKSEVYFDITHSFRHLPMLVMLLLHYTKVVKNIEVGGVFYGAFEVPGEEKPILNLGFFSELQDWTRAVGRFVHTGDVALLYDIIMGWAQPRLRQSRGKDKIALLSRKLADNLSKLIGYIQTCRGPEIVKNREGAELNKTLDRLLQRQYIVDTMPVTLIPLLEVIKSKIRQFYVTDDIDNLLYAIEFCIEHGLIQQGYTLLREYVISKIEQEVVKAGISVATKRCTLRVIADVMFGAVVGMGKGENTFSVDDINIPKQCKKEKENVKEVLAELLNLGTVRALINNRKVFSKLIERRNDINHAGFGRNSADFKTLQKDLKELHKEIMAILTKI